MPTVEIDSDVHEYLRKNVRDFRESESSVLRRLLNLPVPKTSAEPLQAIAAATKRTEETLLVQFVAELRSKYHRTATDKFLAILAFLHKHDAAAFESVLQVGGRKRKYFARSRQEIVSSGTSTHPRQIPGSDYWVMTNADTRQKCDMLRQVLKGLGHSDEDIKTADNAVC